MRSLPDNTPRSSKAITRRDAVKLLSTGATGAILFGASPARAAPPGPRTLSVDPSPLYELSPYLFMQFMEPLGVTDSSVEAAWDHRREDWREDVVDVTRELGPTMLRWGGIYTDYYRWREGVGPRPDRPLMLNLMWGGLESNQVGTAEFVDFARRVGAEPLMCVNFESDGREQFKKAKGSVRTADAREAAEWVAYCNDPDHTERQAHGHREPHRIRYWQLGNETSYDREGFDLATTAAKTIEFSQAMRGADPEIKLIAWGDSGWAAEMIDRAEGEIDLLAFHHMFDPDSRDRPVLRGELYRRDPDATWETLMDAWRQNDAKIREVRDSLGGRDMPLAMTECHFAIPGRDRCDVLSTWAAGVSYARILNNHQRHGDLLKIATAADFCGTRWQVNAVMIPVPHGKSYLMPVARIMKLYRHHIGTHAVRVGACPDGLDVVASRDDAKLYLHVVNTDRANAATAEFDLHGVRAKSITAFEIVDDPMVEVSDLNATEVMRVKERKLDGSKRSSFPAASVTVVEIELS